MKQISPSMMCADPFALGEVIHTFEQAKIEYLHIDVMDGCFVQNYTLGTDYVKALRRHTSIPLDIHLMIDAPERKLDWFQFGEGDYVSVHYESTPHVHRALAAIRARGAKAMLALNPATPICVLEHILDDIDAVLVMTVNPGFSGQALIPSMLKKIAALRTYLDERGYQHIEIEVDGNVSFANAEKMSRAGADIFVVGSSSVFSKEAPLAENIARFRSLITL